MSSVHFVLLFNALLLSMGGVMAYQGRMVPAYSIFGGFGVLLVWQLVLASISNSFSRTYRWESLFRPTHYVQALLHTSMYTYLGLYWGGVPRYAPLILTQIFFGYLCDMLLSWSRGRAWRAGLGVVPIVLSTNLFMWFREPVYFLQLGLIALTFLGKEFVSWNYDGRRRHIVNPSALSLSIASLVLLLTDTVDWTHAVDIAAAFDTPPNFYEVIFLLGLVVQSLFIVTPVSLGAAVAMYLIFKLPPLLFDVQISTTPIQAAVFLGMTFLVTDPATSPRTPTGRFLFGLAYGTGVMLSFVILRLIHEPAIFDKLLIVPVVNLLVPLIDRFDARCLSRRAASPGERPPPPTNFVRFSWLGAYIAFFCFLLPDLKAPQTRPSNFLPPPAGRVSDDVRLAIRGMIICRHEFPLAYQPFGFREEIARTDEIRPLYKTGGM